DDYDLFITTTSTNKDAAFKVISVMLSDEVQRDISHNGRMSTLQEKTIQSEFGRNLPKAQSKNLAALTKPRLARFQPFFKNIGGHTFVNNALNEALYNGKDINTALREADEQMNKAVQEKQSQ
ncbi:MAG: extracellular solute-binding protein family 1, partial [Paenibacillus sp.]|nr:extracellular solute-binding protein family 1 [Paenibacillus sp.]